MKNAYNTEFLKSIYGTTKTENIRPLYRWETQNLTKLTNKITDFKDIVGANENLVHLKKMID